MANGKDSGILEIIAIGAIVFFMWKMTRKRITIPLSDEELTLEETCKNIVYKPLSPMEPRAATLLGKGYCYSGDLKYADYSQGSGDPYAEQQAEEYSERKTAEAIRDINRKVIQFRLINSTASAIITKVLDTTEDSVPFTPAPTIVTDIDGNQYSTVKIGTQEWLVENLKTTKYADGTPITNITDNALWIADSLGAYCWYNNDITNKAIYGALYNWHAVNNANGLAPTGWRVPTHADVATLIAFAGGTSIAGGKLKEVGLTHWNTPNMGATDEYGFKAIPNGARRDSTGGFESIGDVDYRWESTDVGANAYYFYFQKTTIATSSPTSNVPKGWGFAVRCMRDI